MKDTEKIEIAKRIEQFHEFIMAEFKVGCSPLSSRIYVGTVKKDGTWSPNKKDKVRFKYQGDLYELKVEKVLESVNEMTNEEIAKRGNQWPTSWGDVRKKYNLVYSGDPMPSPEFEEARYAKYKVIWILHEMNGDWKPEEGEKCYQFNKPSYINGTRFPFYFGDMDRHWIKFPTEEAAKHFLTYFKELLDQAKPLLS